jgi:3-dehydroquinate synthase
MGTPEAARRVTVDLGERGYDVFVGDGILGDAGILDSTIAGPDVLVVTNETVGPLYLDRLLVALRERRVVTESLPDGEEHKTLASFERILDALADARMHRDATVVALGGGVVGDLAGFAAACYQRGVDVVQVPTTLLAQVDAAVGGKTAVNHPAGKNLIGAFHQPRAVIADVDTLKTLADREYRAGLAEVVKYGVGLDRGFFEWLEAKAAALAERDPDALVEAVCTCCEAKARVVERDEKESGRRALLNLGHTFGHAFETATGYGAWLHGEAVAAGMVMASRLSARLGLIEGRDADRIAGLLSRFGLPVSPPDIPPAQLLSLMGMDKKVLSGRLRLILLTSIGHAFITDECADEDIIATLEEAAGG